MEGKNSTPIKQSTKSSQNKPQCKQKTTTSKNFTHSNGKFNSQMQVLSTTQRPVTGTAEKNQKIRNYTCTGFIAVHSNISKIIITTCLIRPRLRPLHPKKPTIRCIFQGKKLHWEKSLSYIRTCCMSVQFIYKFEKHPLKKQQFKGQRDGGLGIMWECDFFYFRSRRFVIK